jgi:RNA polymerase sigma-70 factor (ECF subfamily)
MGASVARPEVFAEIFDRHAPAIHAYLSRRVGELADDVLSETFLAAFHCRDRYRPERLDVRPWLYGIAANLLRRHRREELARYRALARSAAQAPDRALDDTNAAVDRLDAQALRPALATALADLDERDRETLLLVAWADLSYAETAAVLDVPVGTVRFRLHRARRQLRLRLATDIRARMTADVDHSAPLPTNCIALEIR